MKRIISVLVASIILGSSIWRAHTGYSYVFDDSSLIPQDGFDQADPPFNYRENFAMLEFCIYPEEHETYHDRLNSDYLQTVDEMLTVLQIGKIPGNSDVCRNIKQALGITYEAINVYRKNEINDIFNTYYGTNINLFELPELYDRGYLRRFCIYDEYFVFFLPDNGYINLCADAQWQGGNTIGDADFWRWAIFDTNQHKVVSDCIYTITQTETVHGYTFPAIKYISFTPPSDEIINYYVNSVQSAGMETNITVRLNGNEIWFDQPPVIMNDRTLVPMRAIFEAMGCYVEWDDGMIDVYKEDENIMTLWVDDNEMWLPDGYIYLDVAPVIINDRTLVPVRAITESMGADVEWDESSRTVDIYYYDYFSVG